MRRDRTVRRIQRLTKFAAVNLCFHADQRFDLLRVVVPSLQVATAQFIFRVALVARALRRPLDLRLFGGPDGSATATGAPECGGTCCGCRRRRGSRRQPRGLSGRGRCRRRRAGTRSGSCQCGRTGSRLGFRGCRRCGGWSGLWGVGIGWRIFVKHVRSLSLGPRLRNHSAFLCARSKNKTENPVYCVVNDDIPNAPLPRPGKQGAPEKIRRSNVSQN